MTDEQVRRAVAAMEAYTGTVPGYRRAHARGVYFNARFTPSPAIAELTTAEHLQGPEVPALVRLSNGAGSPYAPDRKPGHHGTTLGLGIRFELASGGYSTWAAASLPNFPARDAEEFIRITTLQKQNPRTGKPAVAPLLAHIATHPHILPGIKGIAGVQPTASFATTRFNGLHAYYLIAPDGTRRAFRYSWVPDAGSQQITDKADREWPPQYLPSEISQRTEPSWSLVFTLAAQGDPVDDVTKQWPSDREQHTAGRLVLTDLHPDQAGVENVVFDPTNVVAGMDLSDDPILHFRSAVYGESYARRVKEDRPTIQPG
ncbi:MAG TPA: catalase [Pseudonocardiaceae bacterium]|jgi:catalase|nr:catalase [Pseudonocardiaceae bacterium]